MKIFNFLLIIPFLLIINGIKAQNAQHNPVLFDFGWRFHKGGALGAEKPDFDDSQWRKVDLPHDWSIEDLPGTNSPFDRNAISQVNGGFTTGGTGWYRKNFTIPADKKDKRVMIQFDGVYSNSEVWLNGNSIGKNPNGYISFWFDLTDKVNFGGNNVIAVKVRNEGENSRWYSGSGIYRHVWLEFNDPIHIAHWGIAISVPQIHPKLAKVTLKTRVQNESKEPAIVKVAIRIMSPKGLEVSSQQTEQNIQAGGTVDFSQDLPVESPVLWSCETPKLYTSITDIYQNSELKDSKETKFGIRAFGLDGIKGLQLNGKPLKLKGGCIHHDNGPLGAKAYDRAEERRVELLKASGFNAVRTAHNPPSPAFLDACDRLGMLVIDEYSDMWKDAKNPDDYHLYIEKWWKKDLENMVTRDRNHPSVFMWSIGNEIPNRHLPEVVQDARTFGSFIHKIDNTRPLTAGVNDLKPDKDPFFAILDIAGYNYATGGDHGQNSIFEIDHQRVPNRFMAGTESYPLVAFQTWMDVLDHPYVIGDFVWTAFDYIGEASIGWRGYFQDQNFFPWNLAFCGDIDICGWKRPQSYYRDVLWKENQVSIFVSAPQPSFVLNPNRQEWSKWHWFDEMADWNWKGNEGKLLDVKVYSSCEQVELFLNDKSLGQKPTDRSTKFTGVWQVPYQEGKLKAIGYTGKKRVNKIELQTSGEPSTIKISADTTRIQANGQDLSYVTIELTDNKGVKNPKAENLLKFSIEGPGTIIGVGNANPVSLESYQLPQRRAWQGRCLVIIKSDQKPGEIVLRATGEGLKDGEVRIKAVVD